MKYLILIPVLLIFSLNYSQSKIITKTGKITFEASVPAFEEVKATNEGVTCVINTTNGEIAALAFVKGFRFKVALMEEHFNENYLESDKFPKATFKGKIEGFDYSKLTTVSANYTIKGMLELHGKSKEISIIAKISKTKSGTTLVSNFDVNSNDFDIAIPSIVSKKVSKKVNVNLEFLLK